MDRSDRVGIAVSVGLIAVDLEDKEGMKSSRLGMDEVEAVEQG